MKIKRAKTSFTTDVNGAPAGLTEGDLVPESHPLAKRFPDLFEPVEDHIGRLYPQLVGVEQATAEPGEKRSLTLPRRGRPVGSKNKPKNEEATDGEA